MSVVQLLDSVNNFFLVYACLLFLIYLSTAVLSVLSLKSYVGKNKNVDYKSMLSFQKIPSVSIIAPAYNEEETIVENIKCLLSVQYQDFEIIIVNDGSRDNSMSKIVEYFDLIKVEKAYQLNLACEPIKGVYTSTNPAYKYLMVVDKENGGKADALNAGIDISQKDLFLALDVDCIIEPDALLKMVKPFLDDSKHVVIASGGVIRIANSCEVANGRIVKVNYARNFWAKFQVLEYFRAFTMGRLAWSKLNGLLIISGAFGLFDRRRVVKAGGYDKTTVGEDLELVVRLRRYMHEVEKRKYRVAFIPDPLCWTEVPESYEILSRQRNRWTRGGIDTILKHKKLLFNPNYGLIGMVSFPYWVFFEWLAPVLQFVGIIYFVIIIFLGLLNLHTFIVLLLFVFTFSVMYSLFAVFYEAYTYNKYHGLSYIVQVLFFIILEMLIYQPLNMFFSLSGNYDFFFKKNRKGWGVMTRTGFSSNKATNSPLKL